MSATAAQNAIAVVGIDIGKNSFHIVALDDRGAIVLRQAAAIPSYSETANSANQYVPALLAQCQKNIL